MTNDIDIIKTLKRNFINEIMSYGVQYDTTLKISAALETVINSLATPSPANAAVGEMPELPEPEIEGEYYDQDHGFTTKQMQAYARAAVLAERQACIDAVNTVEGQNEYADASINNCAAAIRART